MLKDENMKKDERWKHEKMKDENMLKDENCTPMHSNVERWKQHFETIYAAH